ncbi:MAG: multicopper oxidase domain-containing protein [Akkermansiaceae bacterium]
MQTINHLVVIILTYAALSNATIAKLVEYQLSISEQTLSPAGKSRKALTINGGIPGPTLRFRVGDTARITVTNDLKREETSLHWHGLLLPNKQDGVPYLTTPPIKAGKSQVYEFPIKHAGTYWYHSHTGLQEQRGVYGSIVIEPKRGKPDHADREHVLVLSDWTNESPKEVMRTLMRGSEYYAIKKGNAQSIFGASRAGHLADYFQREKTRMAPMDISDVAYDAFLINGKQSSILKGMPGEKIKLRVINAAASTYFYLHSSTGKMTIVAADGPSVQPVKTSRILIGMAETYDVLITIPKSGSWEIRATAQDNSGHASVFLGSGKQHHVSALPSPNLYNMDHMLSAAMGEMASMGRMSKMRPPAPYKMLKSRKISSLPKSAKTREIELRLTGDMTRYIWSFNGKTIAEESTIPVRKGEILRIKLINDTMMHHPLHLHGHFFRLLNGQGKYAPLKHTVDVPPMGKRTIEFLANDEGDWFFHCHLLYHMDAGMARVISYHRPHDPSHKPSLDPKLINPSYFMLEGSLLNTMTMGNFKIMKGREDYGIIWDYDFMHHKEYEIDAYWSHYFSPNLSTMLGYRWTNEMESNNRIFAQANYRLPYLIESSIALDSEGDVRVGIGKEFQLTPRLSIFGDVEYDTNTGIEYMAGASYLLNKQFSLTGSYHSDHGWGFGIGFRF